MPILLLRAAQTVRIRNEVFHGNCEKAIATCRQQLEGARESYQTIQVSLCSLIGSIRRFLAGGREDQALRALEQLEGAVVAAWETVASEKENQIALLDAVGALVAAVNSLRQPVGGEALDDANGKVDDSVSAIIRYLDPDRSSEPGIPAD